MSAAMIRKYRTGWNDPIETVDCTREKSSGVWPSDYMSKRSALKRSEYRQYHDTWAEAKLYLVTNAENDRARAQRVLAEAEETLRTVNALTDEGAT